ncbi:MAG: CDP-alcohol phosphatidyltransferase family protein [Prevotella sp.]|nr:CDP-alcohol phosphatidyltransferase family protein [Prevotella sp.]
MKKQLPNAITCCNLMSGCFATIYAVMGYFDIALLGIIAGAVFDFFDGMVARLLHVSSPIGKELDSLADVVTFGVAPSVMLCMWVGTMITSHRLPLFMVFLPLIMAAFSALRLAKFNLDERQTMGFIGLPTPANALFWASLVSEWGSKLSGFEPILPITLVMMLLSCYLLVSEIPMFALKFKTWGWKGNEVKWIFLVSCVPLVIIFGLGSLAIIVAWYLILAIVAGKYANGEKTKENA